MIQMYKSCIRIDKVAHNIKRSSYVPQTLASSKAMSPFLRMEETKFFLSI